MQFVTVFPTFNSAEAQLVRARLEAAGFHPFVANENAAPWIGGYSTATTINVQVPEEEAAEAKALLAAPPE
jgi:hypothetical protein